MSTSVGASGAFGLLVHDYEELDPLVKEFVAELEALQENDEDDDGNGFNGDKYAPVTRKYTKKFVKEFAKLGIVCPPRIDLHWTADEDSRPGVTQVDADCWILGYGIFMKPWKWPPMDKSFKKAAKFYNWVWAG